MKKIMTIVGTRPELIRLSEIIKLLDIHTEHTFVHTGQNFTPELHDQFFWDLHLRLPDYQFNTQWLSWLSFIGKMYLDIDEVLEIKKPDVILILGDTNSALAAYVAKKRHIPVFHMEAGNRCYNDWVPEEINRKIIDSLSTYLLPYTQRSREHLMLEWYHPSKIIVIWNPISEVLEKNMPFIGTREISENYVLVTLHRDENITIQENLIGIIKALENISLRYKVILSLHPKLKHMIEKFHITLGKNIHAETAFSFHRFLWLEKYASCVLSDSGTVPEECCIFQTPCVLLRTSTERPELLENNSMILSGIQSDEILSSFEVALHTSVWPIPSDYSDTHISEKILKLLLRHI